MCKAPNQLLKLDFTPDAPVLDNKCNAHPSSSEYFFITLPYIPQHHAATTVYLPPNHDPSQLFDCAAPSVTFLSNSLMAAFASLRPSFNCCSACRLASSYFFLASTLYWSSFSSALCASLLARSALSMSVALNHLRFGRPHTYCCAVARTAS